MTLASTLIQRAFREDNLIGVGASPTTDEQTEALAELNNIINGYYGFELSEITHDWYVPAIIPPAPTAVEDPRDPYGNNTVQNTYLIPPVNSRILTSITAATTVYLPQYPNDGTRVTLSDLGSASTALTLSANGRLIEGAASVAVDLSVTPQAEWMYRADLSNWQLRADLGLADDSPFPAKYDKLLTTALSIVLCPRNGREPSAVTVKTNSDLLQKFRAQYKQYTPTSPSYDISELQSFRVDNMWTGAGRFNNG